MHDFDKIDKQSLRNWYSESTTISKEVLEYRVWYSSKFNILLLYKKKVLEYYCNTHNFSILCIKKNLRMECYGKLILTKMQMRMKFLGRIYFQKNFTCRHFLIIIKNQNPSEC